MNAVSQLGYTYKLLVFKSGGLGNGRVLVMLRGLQTAGVPRQATVLAWYFSVFVFDKGIVENDLYCEHKPKCKVSVLSPLYDTQSAAVEVADSSTLYFSLCF